MRLRSALLAFTLLAPVVARAQTTIGSYVTTGCAQGQVHYTPEGSPVRGTPFCVTGTATVELLGEPGRYQLFARVALLPAFATDFTGTQATFDAGAINVVDAEGRRLSGGLFGSRALGDGIFRVGATSPTLFGESFTPVSPASDPYGARLTDASFSFRYQLLDAPRGVFGDGASLRLTFSAVPEPSVFALSAAGLLALAVAARRHARA